EVAARLTAAVAAARPDVVFVHGWAAATARSALRWCLTNRVPAVLMSESTARDEPRRWWKEAAKRRVVRCFAAALVGGTRHREYTVGLGIPPDRVFLGYDTVDNEHFGAGADAARVGPGATRARYG